MKSIFSGLMMWLLSVVVSAQPFNPLLPPNTFRNADNPYYWKNKLPFEGYWQQDVHYNIKANIDELTDIISGTQQLEYWNNSPDELEFVFFHLYQNAFQPGSYYENLIHHNGIKPKWGRYEKEGKGTEILKLQADGQNLKRELDNTILKVWLPKPLKSGESIVFDIEFKTYFDGLGGTRRRMKQFNAYGYKHYDGVHWYPRISVYDRKFGWTTDQHLGHEFYGDFGTYDVELTFSSDFVVEATGFLLNKNQVLPDALRQQLDITNFKNKPLFSEPSIITPYNPNERKTWKYHAENVHDFAFTADPTYRIAEVWWNDIQCIGLVQEPHASRWQNSALYVAKIIKTFSEDFGMYAYNKMVAADAQDGMEYPMITLDGGLEPSNHGLFVHEIAHNWFFGMLGSNETYRAAMDEGFTQFLTSWGLEKIDGDTVISRNYKSKYRNEFTRPQLVRESNVYNGYMSDAILKEDASLNTHSDGFNGAIRHGGGYRHVYYKTAVMLYNLQYVLGDELFLKAMQHYVSQWKIAHPYMEDFRNSIIQYTKVDLNWFFDQWFETTKNIDYKVGKIRPTENKNEYQITFHRKADMQMPIDFVVIDKKDSSHSFHIPNSWFVKETNASVLPRWIGWDNNLNPTYTATVSIPNGIKDVQIDPTYRLADVNQLNNSKKFPYLLEYDHRIYNSPDRKNYELFGRPDFWYNAYDGLKAGAHLNGNYLTKFHVFNLSVWMNSGLGQYNIKEDAGNFDKYSFHFDYKTSTHKFLKGSEIFGTTRILDGLNLYKIGFSFSDRKEKNILYAYFKSMMRYDRQDLNYLLYPSEWQYNKLNNTLNLGLNHIYEYTKGYGIISLFSKTSAIASDYDYAQLSFSADNKNTFGKIGLNTRLFMQYGTGKNVPYESSLYLAGANPEEMMENKYLRSQTAIPEEWLGYGTATNHLQYGGGLNLRGYAGYLNPEMYKDSIVYTYRTNSGASVSTELAFGKLIPFRPKKLSKYFAIDMYLFADAGVVDYGTAINNTWISDVRADAGLGTTFTIKRWGPLDLVKPLTIRFDMPFFLNRPPAVEEYFQFRWVLGISRAF